MIYLDNAATGAPSPVALDAYLEVASKHWGNPSSIHEVGYEAKRYLDKARKIILDTLNLTKTHDCYFLSGASEANNLAIKGVAHSFKARGNKILYGAGEHPSVINACLALEKEGFEAIKIPLKDGAPDPDQLDSNSHGAILSCLMAVNNETGALSDITAFYQFRANHPKCLLLLDATQAMGKLALDYSKADFISFSGHKIGALKGSGALLVKKGIKLTPLIDGGEQENGFRAGTVNVAGAYCLAMALKESYANLKENLAKTEHLHALLHKGLEALSPFVKIHDHQRQSPYVLCFSTIRHKASVIVEGLSNKGIMVSSVSACSSKKENTSYVLEAEGVSKTEAANPIRVSFGPNSTEDDVKGLLDALEQLFNEVKTI